MEPGANHFSSLNPDFLSCENGMALAISLGFSEEAPVHITARIIINIILLMICIQSTLPFGLHIKTNLEEMKPGRHVGIKQVCKKT